MVTLPMDFGDCPCTGRNLPRLLHPAIMAVLAHGPLHGYLITEELEGQPVLADAAPDPAGVYRMLKAMERDGYLTGTDLPGTGRGPARREFSLTPKGCACLRTWVSTLRRYQEDLAILADFLDRRCKAAAELTPDLPEDS
jgi:DNA-binding PadR family transcriptional regulator